MFTQVAIISGQSLLLTMCKYSTQFRLLSATQAHANTPKRWPFESNQEHFYHQSRPFPTVNGHLVNVSILSDFPLLAGIGIQEFAIRLQSEIVTLHETLHVISHL